MDECIRSDPVYLRTEARYGLIMISYVYLSVLLWATKALIVSMKVEPNCKHNLIIIPNNIGDNHGEISHPIVFLLQSHSCMDTWSIIITEINKGFEMSTCMEYDELGSMVFSWTTYSVFLQHWMPLQAHVT